MHYVRDLIINTVQFSYGNIEVFVYVHDLLSFCQTCYILRMCVGTWNISITRCSMEN